MKESILVIAVIAVIVLVGTAAYFFSEEAQDKTWLEDISINVSVQEYSRLWQEIYELQEQMEQLRCEIKGGTYDFRPYNDRLEEGIIFLGKQCKVGDKYYYYENGEFVREESL